MTKDDELRRCKEKINLLESTIAYLKSQEKVQNERIEKLEYEIKLYEDALNEIIEKTSSREYQITYGSVNKKDLSIKNKQEFIIDTIKNKLLTLYIKIRELSEEKDQLLKKNKTYKDTLDSIQENADIRENKPIVSTKVNFNKSIDSFEEEKKEIEKMIYDDNEKINDAIPEVKELKHIRASDIVKSVPNQINSIDIDSNLLKAKSNQSGSNFKKNLFAPSKEYQAQQANYSKKENFQINDLQELIILTIGSTGEFVRPRIIEMVINNGAKQSQSAIYNNIMILEKNGLLKKTDNTLKIGSGRPSDGFLLTEKGNEIFKRVYFEKYNKDMESVQSLYYTFISDSKSVEHGEFIRKVEDKLKLENYITITDENKMKINFNNGRSTICDIIAQKNNNIFRIEVECGNYSKEKMKEKIEKILDGSSQILFVCKNMDVKNYILDMAKLVLVNKFGDINIKDFKEKGGMFSIVSFEEFLNKNDWPQCEKPIKQIEKSNKWGTWRKN